MTLWTKSSRAYRDAKFPVVEDGKIKNVKDDFGISNVLFII